MVKEIKEKVNNMSVVPQQKTTYGGIAVIIQQLITVLSDVPVGGWIASLTAEGVTYGVLLSSYWPILAGVILIIFNEDKFKSWMK